MHRSKKFYNFFRTRRKAAHRGRRRFFLLFFHDGGKICPALLDFPHEQRADIAAVGACGMHEKPLAIVESNEPGHARRGMQCNGCNISPLLAELFHLSKERPPHALALRGMVPGAATLERVNAQLDIPVPSAILSFAASALWLGLHYWSQRGGWLPNADLSECTVAFSYLFYMAVYFLLIRLFFRGKAGGWVSGVLIPLLATLGGLLILAGGTHNPLFWPAAAVVTAVLAAAVWRYGGPVSRAGGIRP